MPCTAQCSRILFARALKLSGAPHRSEHAPDNAALPFMSTSTDAVAPPAYVPAQAAAVSRAGAIPARSRIASIDVMRGLVMLIMLVDHVREAIYRHLQVSDPMNVATTAPDLFFTRLSAHLCAPTFVFLTGLSAWLYAHPPAGGTRPVRGFLLKRGLLLVVLELTLVNFAWSGEFPATVLWLQVIWAIGLSMMVLAVLSGLPRWALAALGFVIVFGHNALTSLTFPPGSVLHIPWVILHERAYLIADGPLQIKVTYPVLPWIGVILLGYVAGPLYSRAVTATQRTKVLLGLGVGCLCMLALLRGFNIYGETSPWTPGADFTHTLMSWVDFTKYPPSLDFLLLTLGAAFLLLAAFESRDNRATRTLVIFGGAPMFFYLLHLYTLLVLYRVALALFGPNHGERFGVDHVWCIWVVAASLACILYFPCRAFTRFKRTSSQAWVRYF